MKVTVLTNIKIKPEDIAEAESFGLEITVRETTKMMPAKYNPYFNANWGDFDWIRAQITEPTSVRAFVTSRTRLRNIGVTGHLGMYDAVDGDAQHDCYIGIPDKLTTKAKNNGFKSDFARILIHEILHGEERQFNGLDRTHAMEDQGKLKELWEINAERRAMLKEQISLWQRIKELLGILKSAEITLHPRLPKEYNEKISQAYGVQNSVYTLTGRHIGVDYACPVGTSVFAPYDGEVIVSGQHSDLGKFCYFRYIYQGKTRVERFLHLDRVPSQGEYRRGEKVAETGNTGFSSGPHFHVDGWWDEVKIGSINKNNWDELTYNPHISYDSK